MKSIDRKTMLLLGTFIASLIAANLLGPKITTILGISVSVGIFAVPITFLCTDIVEEVRGKKVTKIFIYVGVIALLFVMLLVLISINMPPSSRYASNDAFVEVFGTSTRMILASIISFVIAQTHDIWAFNFWKKQTRGRYLWLRNNLSTVISQLIDTTLFMFIALYNVTPMFDTMFIINLIIPYWLFKVAFAFLDTPLVYLGVKWLKSK